MKVQEGVSLEEVRRLFDYVGKSVDSWAVSCPRRLPSRVPLELTIDRLLMGDEGAVRLDLL